MHLCLIYKYFLHDKSFRDVTYSSSCQVKVNLPDNGGKNSCVRTEAWRHVVDSKVDGFLFEETTDRGTVGGRNRVSEDEEAIILMEALGGL